MITIRFACGHQAQVEETKSDPPVCGCGERRVQAVAARAVRFTGACTGPYAETRLMEPLAVSLAERPLVLKEQQP